MPFAVHDTPPAETVMELPDLPMRAKEGYDSHMLCENGDEDSSQFSMSPREEHDQESEMCLRLFESWNQSRQTEFIEQLIARMSFHQHEHIYSILMPMLQRDFITALPGKRVWVSEGEGWAWEEDEGGRDGREGGERRMEGRGMGVRGGGSERRMEGERDGYVMSNDKDVEKHCLNVGALCTTWELKVSQNRWVLEGDVTYLSPGYWCGFV